MKTVYIAHPISGDVQQNLKKVAAIFKTLALQGEVLPVAPYFISCHALNDENKAHREAGMRMNVEHIKSGALDELWLYGPSISPGMYFEVMQALKYGVKVVAKTTGTKHDLNLILKC